MHILDKHVDFVKEQLKHYDKMAVKNRNSKQHQKVYLSVAENLRNLLTDIENVILAEAHKPDNSSHQLEDISGKLPENFLSNPYALTPQDYAGLEDDILEQLNITEGDKLDSIIVNLMRAAGGVLVLDKIIIGVYHLTGEKHQRTSMTAKLYRMAKKNIIHSVPKKKGVYSLTDPNPEELSKETTNDKGEMS